MLEFDQIDLINFAVYGNEKDPEWDSIRNFVSSNPTAREKMEDLKKSLLLATETQKQMIKEENYSGSEANLVKSTTSKSSRANLKNGTKKSWWRRLTGD